MTKFKKVLAAVLAGTMVFGSLAVSAFAGQDTADMADATAYLNLNTADWTGPEAASVENVVVDKNGDYTVSYTAKEAFTLGDFNALEILNGETVLGSTYVVTVTSIKIDGVEKKTGEGFTCSADGKGVTTRVNIYNSWNDPDAEATAGDDKHLDQRCAGGDVTATTARMVDQGLLATTVEVAFTVSGLADTDTEGGDSTSTALILAAVAALAVVATVSTKRFSFER